VWHGEVAIPLPYVLEILQEAKKEFLADYSLIKTKKGVTVKTSHHHPSYRLGEWFVKWFGDAENK
jgi:hypothetical protein